MISGRIKDETAVNTYEFKRSESSYSCAVCASVCAGKPIHGFAHNREETMISLNIGHVFREKCYQNETNT